MNAFIFNMAGLSAKPQHMGVAMKTFASLFTGGGLADVGARAAGLKHRWGIELDPFIAGVAADNGFAPAVGDVCNAVFTERGFQLQQPFWLHMSPPCTNASTAKQDAGETELDRDLARACIRAIDGLRPPRVSLENVWGYRNFESFQMIYAALTAAGYQVRFWHLNSANYGVPQTRKRLILVASLDSVPVMPAATHAPGVANRITQGSMFEQFALSPWVGWYEAIEDILDTLPVSAFAPWQLERLEKLELNTLVGNQFDGPNDNPNRMPQTAGPDYPAPAVMAGDRNKIRAFLANCKDKNAYNGNSPLHGHMVCTRSPVEPAATVMGQGPQPRAFLASGADSGHAREAGKLIVRGLDAPAGTVTAGDARDPSRAWLETGRVVSMTVRALARFQSVPDSYELPESNGLGAKIVGNGVPPLLMQRVIEANL